MYSACVSNQEGFSEPLPRTIHLSKNTTKSYTTTFKSTFFSTNGHLFVLPWKVSILFSPCFCREGPWELIRIGGFGCGSWERYWALGRRRMPVNPLPFPWERLQPQNKSFCYLVYSYGAEASLPNSCLAPLQNVRVPQKECGKRSSITFFRFRDAFGHFSVTFSDAFVTFFVTFLPDSFCRTPFAAGWKWLRAGNRYCWNLLRALTGKSYFPNCSASPWPFK